MRMMRPRQTKTAIRHPANTATMNTGAAGIISSAQYLMNCRTFMPVRRTRVGAASIFHDRAVHVAKGESRCIICLQGGNRMARTSLAMALTAIAALGFQLGCASDKTSRIGATRPIPTDTDAIVYVRGMT
ncbi:MAG: hypothetical protein V3T70_01610 [Phycisphaerae bacterium]